MWACRGGRCVSHVDRSPWEPHRHHVRLQRCRARVGPGRHSGMGSFSGGSCAPERPVSWRREPLLALEALGTSDRVGAWLVSFRRPAVFGYAQWLPFQCDGGVPYCVMNTLAAQKDAGAGAGHSARRLVQPLAVVRSPGRVL